MRALNLLDSTFLVIGGVLGSGIFITTGLVANDLPSPALILIVFLVGGFITLCGALSFAELGAMFPQAGGPYVYLREAYGPAAGFLYGWVFFWVIQCGGLAALAVAFADYAGRFLPASFSLPLFDVKLSFIHWSLVPGQLLAVAAILVLSLANYFGLKAGTLIQNIFTFLRLACAALFIIEGLIVAGRLSDGPSPGRFVQGMGSFRMTGFGLALVAVLWAYDGWYSVSCAAEEVKNPKRNIPLSLILGTLTVTVIYLLINLVYFLALPLDKIAGVERIGETAALRLFGPSAGGLMSGLIALTIFGCLSATVIYGPRVFYAMAKDGLFFSSLKDIHRRYRVPGKAVLASAAWACLLCLSGNFQSLIEYVVFALMLFFAGSGLAIIVLRRRRPNIERPYRAWGYPILPCLFVFINLAVFANRIIARPKESLGGTLIIVLGIPAYLYWRAKGRRSGPAR